MKLFVQGNSLPGKVVTEIPAFGELPSAAVKRGNRIEALTAGHVNEHLSLFGCTGGR
jgi:hypothetical protein